MYTTAATYGTEQNRMIFSEKSDHLGNVRAVVSDIRKPSTTTGDIDDWTWEADITDHFSYYPFGMLEPGRQKRLNTVNAGGYRFGFNGMEKDDEISGSAGSHYTAEYWEYDSRIGRRWNTDPLSYSWQSPYACFNNNPVYFADPSGLEGENPNEPPKDAKQGDTWSHTDKSGTTWNYKYEGSDVGWVGTGGSGTLNEVTVSAKQPSWLSRTWKSVKNWINTTDFVVDGEGKVDIGVQAKLKGSWGGVVQGEANVNLVSFELLGGRADLTELYSDNPDAYSGNYIGDGDGAKVSQGIGVVGGVAGYDVIGADYKHTFRTHGEGYFDEKHDYGVYAVVPLLKNKKASDISKRVQQKALESAGMLGAPGVKKPKVDKDGDFYGIDLGVGAALIVGVEVNIKLGFKR